MFDLATPNVVAVSILIHARQHAERQSGGVGAALLGGLIWGIINDVSGEELRRCLLLVQLDTARSRERLDCLVYSRF
jgi:hypothetical protein